MILPIEIHHLKQMSNLLITCGFPARSEAGWKWALFDNPEQGDEPAGYVKQNEDGYISAFLGSQRLMLRRHEEVIPIVTGHTFISDLKAPGTGGKLLRHMIKNQGSEAIITLNNNTVSAPILPKFGFRPWLGIQGQTSLQKPLDWTKLISAWTLRKYGRNTDDKEYFSKLRNETPPAMTTNGFQMLDPFREDHGDLLDDFSLAMQSGEKFQPDRSAKIWRYRNSDPDRPCGQYVYASMNAGRIDALLAVFLGKETPLNPITLEFADMAFRPGVNINVSELLNAAEMIGRHMGVTKINLRTCPAELIPEDFAHPGWMRRVKSYHNCHALFKGGQLEGNWSPGPMEGDYHFALRHPPGLNASIQDNPHGIIAA